MQIYANIREKVDIDPIDVIDGLIELASGCSDASTIRQDGKFYKIITQSAGQHSFEFPVEIDEPLYDYINSLIFVKMYLQANMK